MNLKRWLYLFWTTLALGAGCALIAGEILKLSQGTGFKNTADFFIYMGILIGVGIMVSVYSQMGFFAYLMMNYMGTGVFSRRTWQYIQLVLTALALLELMFFRIFVSGESGDNRDITLGLIILLVAAAVSYFKVKATNPNAWIPTLFFMIAGTIVEMVGVLKIQVNFATTLILVPLIACNAYQILLLHKLVKKSA
ncbi:KinB signaling pathway activation protein [Paenibacillus zeisoli]|uniref:KinB signaling pathway activation protein n=1 Tax=Paenibacillus zeisoli TaxID=2496267 RepID=A0A433X158_9BACL|nr:KinB-signaling pathway activation protein [Paenibacillus zeisoli]RUT27895.1 KinB signaling pathway activation protein [Paenibacillus zeisoli]